MHTWPTEKWIAWAAIALFVTAGIGEGLAQAAFGTLGGLCLIGSVRRGQWRDDAAWLWALPTTPPLLAFLAWSLVTMFANRFGIPRASHATRIVNFLPLLLVPWTLRLAPGLTRTRLAWALVFALAVASILGIAQYTFNLGWGGKIAGVVFDRQEGIDAPADPSHHSAVGFFFNRLRFAHALLAGLALALPLLSETRRRALLGVTTALIALALALTFARGAAAAAAIGLGVALVFAPRPPGESRRAGYWVMGGAVLLTALVALLVPHMAERLASTFSLGAYADRRFLWARALEIIADYPIIGIGSGNYDAVCPAYYDRVDPTFAMRTTAHNQFLTTWAETGPLGLLLWLWLWWRLFRHTLRPPPWGRAGLMLMSAATVLSIAHDPFFHPSTMIAWCSVLGLVIGQYSKPLPPMNSRRNDVGGT